MIRPVYATIAFAALICLSSVQSAQARGNDWTITDGMGEQVKVKHGFFGHTDKTVQDRLGDGMRVKKGFFGSKETDVNLLGNQFQKKKGWFGSSDLKGRDILGDSVTTKKGIFGRRTTTVNVGGAASVIQGLFADKKPRPPMPPNYKPGAVSDPLTPLGDPNDPNALGGTGTLAPR